MDERRVKIGVDTGDLDSAFGKLKQRAEEAVRSMIADSRALSISSKEVLKDLRERIDLQERLSRTESQSQVLSYTQRLTKGVISPEQYSQAISGLRMESKEQFLLTSLMRELIDTVKETSKQEIIEDRKTVEETISASKRVEELNPEGDEIENLKETIQKGLLQKEDQDKSQRLDKRDLSAIVASNLVGPFMQMARQLVGSKNVNYFAADVVGDAISGAGGLLSKIPGLSMLGPLLAGAGQVATSFFNRGLSAGEQFEETAARYYRITGRGVAGVNRSRDADRDFDKEVSEKFKDYLNSPDTGALPDYQKLLTNKPDSTHGVAIWDEKSKAFKWANSDKFKEVQDRVRSDQEKKDRETLSNLESYGLNRTEFLEAKSEYARGSVREGRLSNISSILAERGLDLSRGELVDLSKSLRTDTREGLAGNVANLLMGTLIKGGTSRAEAREYLPEYLNTLVSLNKQQLDLSQKVDSVHNIQMIEGIKQLDKSFNNPEVLSKVVSGIQGGLSTSNTPQAEALQYSVLNRIAPGASLWQLQKMRANPFGKGNEDYLYKTLESISQMSSTAEESYMNTYGFFQGQLSQEQSERLMRGYRESIKSGKKPSISDIAVAAGVSLESEAGVGRGTSYMVSQNKKMDDFFIEAGQKLIGYSKAAVEAVEGIFESIIGKSGDVKKNEVKKTRKL